MSEMASFPERISAILKESRGCPYYQLYIASNQAVKWDLDIRERGSRRSSGLFSVYCAFKPVVALTLAHLLETHGFDESVPVASLLGETDAVDVTIRDLLHHSVGLGDPDAFAYQAMRADARLNLSSRHILSLCRPGVADYSEVTAWILISSILETLSAELPEVVVDHRLEEAGLTEELANALQTSSQRDRLAFYEDSDSGLPLLHDRLPAFSGTGRQFSAWGFASARGLGLWYQKLVACCLGTQQTGYPSPEMARRWVSSWSEYRFERRLGRAVRFSLGFVDMSAFFGERIGNTSFGQTGFLGNSFAWCDLNNELTVAFVTPSLSVVRGAPDEERWRLLDAILDEVS